MNMKPSFVFAMLISGQSSHSHAPERRTLDRVRDALAQDGYTMLEGVAHSHARADEGMTTAVTFHDDEHPAN
jgi:hypothetical protein